MNARELDEMVKTMRRFIQIDSRTDLSNLIYVLSLGAAKIGKDNLCRELSILYNEVENVDTEELVNVGTFLDLEE